MEAKKHSAYQEESLHLSETTKWIKRQNVKLKSQEKELTKDIVTLKKEVSSALDERLLLKEQMKQMVDDDLDKFTKIQSTPYFGRINFSEKYKDEVEVIYIGKFGLYDSELGNILVLDWRAPMSNIYYSGLDEEVSYRTPNGVVEGTMHLKRRYVLEEGKLLEIYDEKSLQDNLKESISQNSSFLIDSLNKSTSGRLTEIVATIQDEQNKILRSEALMPLIVQGVAGSGKTTIALHRMAYIIYNRQHDKEAKYMVVAPNKLFLNYIEDILPDLGVDHVFQTTFEDWALAQLGKSIKLTTETDKLNKLLTEESHLVRSISLAAKLRGSMLFKRVIDLKLAQIEKSLIPREGIKYEETVLIPYQELQEIFLVSNNHMSLEGRIKRLGEYLKKRLKDKQTFIEECIEISYRCQIQTLKRSTLDIETIRPQIIALYNERDIKIKSIKKWIPHFVKDYIKELELPLAKAFYFGLWEIGSLGKLLSKQIKEEEVAQTVELMQQNFAKNIIETEDLGPLLYIQLKLYGMSENRKYSHIVVDEAQDLDEMKLTVLREVSLNDAFTLVGDLSQGIYDYKGITNWERMMKRVFEDKKYNYYEMSTSYRSTIEIIDFANEIITHCQDFNPLKAKPVLRHGQKPLLIGCKDEQTRLNQLVEDINQLQKQGMVSIGILTEHKDEGYRLYQQLLDRDVDLEWLCEEKSIYAGKVVVMPSYISKGLEFDAVLIYDVSDKRIEPTSLDIKLLYVMVTRALHRLNMYYIGEASLSLQNSHFIESIRL